MLGKIVEQEEVGVWDFCTYMVGSIGRRTDSSVKFAVIAMNEVKSHFIFNWGLSLAQKEPN